MAAAARSSSWVAVPPALLTLVVSLAGIGRYPLGNDEYATWHASTLSFPDLFRLLNHQDVLLGPHYLAMHAWIELAGASAGHLRAPSAAAMACAAGLVALIGRRLLDPWTGLGAGLMFAGIPTTSVYGQEARPYAFAVAGVLLATLLLLRAIDEPSRRGRWAWYGVALVVVALSHVVALSVLAAHAVMIWQARGGDDRPMRRWVLSTAVPLVVLLPLMVKGSTQTGAISWIKADAEALRELPERMFGSATVALVVIALAVLAAAALRNRTVAVLLTWALVPPVFCLLTSPWLHLFLYRYVLFTVPAWVLLAAALPRALARDARRWFVAAGTLVLSAVVGIVGLPDQEEARRLPLHEPGFPAAARVVEAGMRDGDGIVFAATRRDTRRAFRYLHATGVVGAPKDVLLGRTAQELGRFQGTECVDTAACLAGTDRIWLVTDAEPGPRRVMPLSSRAQAMLRAEFDAELVRSVGHLQVHLLRRTA